MEVLSCKIAKIVGTPDESTWSQVHTFTSTEFEKNKKRGTLLAVLSVSMVNDGLETAILGKEVLSRLHEEYYGEITVRVMERLSQTITKVFSEFEKKVEGLEIVAGVLVENVLYLVGIGGGAVLVKRGNVCEKILEIDSEKMESASGFVQAGDLIVLGTSSFFGLASDGILKAALENNDPQEAVDSLAPLVQAHESSSISAVVAVVKTEEKEPLEEFSEKEESVVQNQQIETKVVKEKKKFSLPFSFSLPKLPRVKLEKPQVTDLNHEGKNKKVIFTVGIILILMIAASLFFGSKKREATVKEEKFNQGYEEIVGLLGEGESLAGVTPNRSRELLEQAKGKFSEIEQLNIETNKTQELKNRIDALFNQVVKEYHIDQLPLFFDLSLIVAEGKGDKMALSGDSLIVLDKNSRRLFKVDVNRKSGEVLSGKDLSNPALLSINGNKVFVLDEKGITSVGLETKQTEKDLITETTAADGIVDFDSYGGNLYLLDKNQKALWRYISTESGFGTKQNWFGTNSYDLSGASSLAIDGSVWILTKEGKIFRFNQGGQESFTVKGLDKNLVNANVIFTDLNTQNIYILDAGNNRVAVLNKAGEYQSQYNINQGMTNITDMVVSESNKKIFLLEGSKIYQVDLK